MVMNDSINHPLPTYTITPLPRPLTPPQNDTLDDIFGSAPTSPSLYPSSPSHVPSNAHSNTEISDIPRLQEKHQTEGYRDGVTRGKAQTVQQGFDEGYTLGAVFGLRIGKILGVLEGIYGAVRTLDQGQNQNQTQKLSSTAPNPPPGIAQKDLAEASLEANGAEIQVWEAQIERLASLVKEAKVELRTESVFNIQYWGEDGIWKYTVPGEGEGEGMDTDVVFDDVVGAHPLLRKWEGVMGEEVRLWGVELGIWEGDGIEEVAEREEVVKSVYRGNSEGRKSDESSGKGKLGDKKVLSW